MRELKSAPIEIAQDDLKDSHKSEVQNIFDKRLSKRIVFYKGEFPSAFIEFAGKKYKCDVYDISTDGIGLLPEREIPGLDPEYSKVSIQYGTSRNISAVLKKVSFIKFSGSMRLKLGFSLEKVDHFQQLKDKVVYECGSSMPMVYCEDPVAFNKVMIFNATRFSSQTIFLRTKDDESALYQGLCLDLKVMMPVRGEFSVTSEVVRIERRKDVTEVECVLINPTSELSNAISEFLLMTVKGLSVNILRENGFKVKSLEKAYVFKNATTPEQINRILALRLKAAQKDGRWIGETDIQKMSDRLDKFSRHLYCEINGEVVASFRLVFNNGIPEKSEHVSYGVTIPDWLWEAGFVEGSRLCTDPDFRGAELFFLMIQNISKVVIQSGNRYVLINCVDSLVKVYKKTAGVHSLNQKFYTPYMQDRALNLLYSDARQLQLGFNFQPTSWILNVPLGMYMLANGNIKLNWWEKPIKFIFHLKYTIFSKVLHLLKKK